MNRTSLRSSLLGALLLGACMSPTENSGRFGEARVQPEFAAGDAPAERGVDVDSIRTVMTRGADRIVNALMIYEADEAQAWILELQNTEDSVEVTMELMVGSNVAYRGSRKINVVEGTPGHAPVEDIPVSLIETDFASSIKVVPDHVVFTSFGATRQLTAEVYDRDNELIDKPVSWSSQNNSVVTVDTRGLITAAGLGTTHVLATVDGVTGSATIVVDTMLAHRTTITADSSSIAADGKSTTQLTVRVLDATGALIGFSAGNVALTSSLGSVGAVADHGNGTYTATLTAGMIPGDALVTGTLNGTSIDDSETVRFRPHGSVPGGTTIEADSVAIDADGKSRTLITVKVRNAQGQLVGKGGDTVSLLATLGTLSGINDHADGTYTATLVSASVPGLAIISGTLNGKPIADSAFVIMRPKVPVSLGRTTINADSASIAADGVAITRVLVTMLDANGNPTGVSGGVVLLTTSLGSLSTPVIDHGNGTYSAQLTAGTTAGLAVVAGTLNGQPIADSAFVVLRASGSQAGLLTQVVADSTAINADGNASTLITVIVVNANGTPLSGSPGVVQLSTSLGAIGPVTEQSFGRYTATLTAGLTAGVAAVTGTRNGAPLGDTAFVTLRPRTPSTGRTTITADSAAIDADGSASTRVTVTVLDANGVPVGASAGVVQLLATLGNLSAVTDHGDGTYTAALTADTIAGIALISGTVNGQLIADTAAVVFRPGPAVPGATTITADSAAINRGGVASTRVLVTVRDAHGNPVGASAGVVVLTTTHGTLSAVTDHGDGTYTAILTSPIDAGFAVITGTLNGVAINGSATVQIRQQRT